MITKAIKEYLDNLSGSDYKTSMDLAKNIL